MHENADWIEQTGELIGLLTAMIIEKHGEVLRKEWYKRGGYLKRKVCGSRKSDGTKTPYFILDRE